MANAIWQPHTIYFGTLPTDALYQVGVREVLRLSNLIELTES